jgi:sterol desaturase/sphingolipid hydroxylase (fatty acid hydroxylase superfamily)
VHWIRIESAAYWSVFVVAFLACAIWESFRPKRNFSGTERRWGKHGILLIICTVASVALYRISPVVMALNVTGSRFGLLNRTWLPFAVRCVIAILALDLVRYSTHRLSHSVGALWRFHQVHHSDPDFDISTALRVHPIEVVLTQGAYLLTVAVLAPPVVAVLIAELGSILQSFFSHANASLPRWVEKPLRAVFVTPDMHRIHHSEEVAEQYKNLSDIFPWWDHLFGTYVEKPAAGDDKIVTGLKGFQNERSLGIGFMLAQPFRKDSEQTTPAEASITNA